MKRLQNIDATNTILWAVYLALLGVLLPHTAWLFSRFEPGEGITGTAWAAAFAFESAIAVLTHKLAKHIEGCPKYKNRYKRFAYRYLNAFSVGLLIAVGVSALANLAHAVEYGQTLRIFAEWGVAPKFYQLSFGAILPVVSLLFARVLSNVTESEHSESESEQKINELQRTVNQLKRELNKSEQNANKYLGIDSESVTERINAVHSLWPELPQRSIAVIAGVSATTVNQTLKNKNERK